ncbi:MAG: adenylyl-sulfate kinase [Saprospiraceae bacterium]|nr:adenylyl-sulfate kinase [Saprospiraceae bacterium]
MAEHIHPIFDRILQRSDREAQLKQRSKVIWMTGLSGSGKSTLALALERALYEKGFVAQVLDGDNIRSGLNRDLHFSEADRQENIRRIAEVAKLYLDSGIIVICSFVSPTRAIRGMARDIVGEKDFVEIFVNTPLEVCERRDVKGLYAKARAGEIADFTGISAPYEAPEHPDFEVLTSDRDVEDCNQQILDYLMTHIRH